MFFNVLLFSGLFLIPVALAVPSRLGKHLTRSRGGLEQGTATINLEYSEFWAGAAWMESIKTFNSVTGTFIVPTLSGASGSSFSAWVGIDGVTCTSAMLRTGVDIIDSFPATYRAWYEWVPGDGATAWSDFGMLPGDTIKLSVTAVFPYTFGITTIENQTRGQSKFAVVSSNTNTPLCLENAEWIIGDVVVPSGVTPLSNFGTFTFTNAQAAGPNIGSYGPAGGTLFDIVQNSQRLTSSSASGATVTIKYQPQS